MKVSEFDLQLGQLALARGMIDLSTLLRCTTELAHEPQRLSELLNRRGYLSDEQIAELEEALAEMSPEEVAAAVEAGETVTLQSLEEQAWREGMTDVKKLLGPIEKADTISSSPPKLLDDEKQLDTTELTALGTPPPEERYEFLEELGRGGMGQILLARDRLLGREIALKTVLPQTSVEQPRDRLLAEAQLTGRLEHPSIVPVYELGRLSSKEPYYTMRVITEENLDAILDQLRDNDPDAPSLLNLVQIIRQVCLAVQYAHDHGVIHRDLKPENVLVGKYGEVFVIDWGIAKILSHVTDVPSPTTDVDNKVGALVGTPQYMAPEQAHGENDIVDERTDVYALGAMLYELMTLTPVFSSPTVLGLLMTIVQEEPQPPSQRAPERSIPRPLEEICLRALSKDPDDRYQSAQSLADELDLFIEGVKEKERQLANARELIDEASRAKEKYDQARQALECCMKERDELRATTPAWAEEAERLELWEREDRVEQLQVEVERQFGQTVRLLGQSLGHAPLDEAHDAMAGLYWTRFVEAEKRGDRPMATYFENLVRQHDTGAFTDRLRGLAQLSIHARPANARLRVLRIREHHRRLVPAEVVADDEGPLELTRLPHGRYLLEASAPHYAPVRLPIVLERLAVRQMDVRLWPRASVPEDFVVIPAGEFITGPPDELGVGEQRIFVGDFAIQQTPVTCAQYIDFLNDIAGTDPELADQHAPRTQAGAPSYFPRVNNRYVIPEEDAEGDAWDPSWPICIVNLHNARAYASWRSKRDGLTYRLPTSEQWEKAARGIDGRLYPWGDHFDPSFCNMRDSRPGKPMPAPVRAYESDISPYGVRDMAGNISDWTRTEQEGAQGTFLLRGGSYNAFPLMCRLDWYMHSPAAYRHPHYGFRLSLALDDGEN